MIRCITRRNALLAGAAALLLSGCGSNQAPPAETAKPAPGAPALESLVTRGMPEKSTGVAAAKKEAKTGGAIVLAGRVKDFVDGAAVLTLADASMKDCKQHGDGCPTPWDYCCIPPKDLAANVATVKLVDASGQPVTGGLKGVAGLDHLKDLAAEGKVVRDEAGNLIVEASRLYVKP